MNKITHAITIAAVVLLLAGCASAPEVKSLVEQREPVRASETPTPAPITAEPEAPAEEPVTNPNWGDYTQDEFFLASMEGTWHGTPPTDAQLIGAARLACDTIRNGTAKDAVRVVEGQGEDADWNNSRIVLYGVDTYCPEFS